MDLGKQQRRVVEGPRNAVKNEQLVNKVEAGDIELKTSNDCI